MKQNLEDLLSLFRQDEKALLDDYLTFLRFPSISSESGHEKDVQDCCQWLASYLKNAGLSVEIWPTQGHPIIYASWLEAGPDQPTVLIYNHYDVQPVDPLDLWTHPPFEPHIDHGQVYARGAQDNKGQCFYVVTAIAKLLKRDGRLPVNVKLCIEGEEEMGSVQLAAHLSEYAPKLKADYFVVVDVGLHEPEVPSVTLGVRGLATLTAVLTGSNTDLHSGSHGGIVYNPNRALVEVLGRLFDEHGRVQVPGFYDNVTTLSPAEREVFDFSFDGDKYREDFQAEPNGGEQAFAPLESAWLRPTLEINGIHGGYSGSGFKTVIPAQAMAKISCRLVPNQDPRRIAKLVKEFLVGHTPAGMKMDVTVHAGIGEPMRTSPDSVIVQCAAQAFSEVFDKPCRFILDGATIPITSQMARSVGAETVLLGYGLPSDRIHAPDEHFGLDRIEKGFVTIARLLELLRR